MSRILAIETSCDETAAAVIVDGQYILANIVASQIDIHRRYGGIFPEVASRQHILAINTVIQDAMTESRTKWAALDAVAVTYGPGLSGSLLVGVNTAKGIALAQGIPLIGVNHLEGHLYSNWLAVGKEKDPPPDIVFPALNLIVSGGHTELVLLRGHQDYEILGRTIDDAAGEAFDKAARLLGLGYPGGPAIQKGAVKGNPNAFKLPRAKTKRPYDFSFSGLKTAVLRIVQRYDDKLTRPADAVQETIAAANMPVENLAASTQMAIVDALVSKTKAAAEAFAVKEVLISGGVSANALLRRQMTARLSQPVRFPPLTLCTDNAAMIGAAAHWLYEAGQFADWDLDVVPNLKLKSKSGQIS